MTWDLMIGDCTPDGAPLWCGECGRHLGYSFRFDAWRCPAQCRRLQVTGEAMWRLGELLNPLLHSPSRSW